MIKMIRGVFGLPVNGIVKAMDKNSGAFQASAEQEERLVKLGLAVRVDAVEQQAIPDEVPEDDGTPIGFDETPPALEIPEYNEAMKAPELREIGAMFGLTFKVGMSKKEMVAALDAHFEAIPDEDVDTDEDAPVFDAAEAVQ